jgi:putative ABC transport system ATP-binding protein
VARAIVNQPPLLLADEPTGNLDRATGTQILELLRALNGEGQTVITVTHDEQAAGYANRRIDILDGRIVRAHRDAGHHP